MSETFDNANERLRISLVIPVRDEAATIQHLLDSIAAQTRRPDEVLIVDGGSRDETVELLRHAGERDATLRVVEAGEATPGRGRNVGIAAARHDWIALTDAGNRLEPDWLERLEDVVRRDPSVTVVYGNFEPVADTFFERCAALTYPPPKQSRAGEWMRGPFIASSLLKREVWQSVGGFPDLRAAEDLMFMEAVEREGWKTGWSPRATVWWQLRPTLASTFRKFVLYSRHNVWAGRQRFWHYGIARQYALVAVFVLLALLHSRWWLVLPVLGLAARAAKSIWRRREGRGILWALNPAQFAGVAALIVTIDAATFVGWAQALVRSPAPANSTPRAAHKSQS
ncbi:MAG TPA: glycosyltransferase [Pyrinomonadaceae bacterium]|jgi:glycosyltransferase involved in cell wall biosynthesis|nr:glycosyltransferase [Pyrinomonadaceae bacterium]